MGLSLGLGVVIGGVLDFMMRGVGFALRLRTGGVSTGLRFAGDGFGFGRKRAMEMPRYGKHGKP